ncbi:MBL fold metallo-hydrolase [Pontixanthobacter aquaemixtae]|uniref:MBL fold metallo-hydrolase n=1 Tax=Pontixanthobacter aquaemixtae TaxID=1958940 RepID=UPI002E2633D9
MRKILIGTVVLAGVLIASGILLQTQIGTALFKRGFEQNIDNNTVAGLPDGLHVGLCGTGSPMPNPQRAGPCNIVIAGNQVFVVDIGEGGARNMALMGFDASRISALLLTHFHSDHIDGMGPLMLNHWVRGARTSPLPVYGPTGVEAITDGFNAAYSTDNTYRTAHHGEAVAPLSGGGAQAMPFEMEGQSAVVLERGELKITAFKVPHNPADPAVGYRFDYKGRSFCISGDTAKSPSLERVCKNVDVLVHEALQPALVKEMQSVLEARGNASAAKIMFDIQDYHASPEEAAESAQTAGAEMLVLSHLVPPLPLSYLYPAFLGDAASRFDGPLIVGEDGMLFSLPADSNAIEQSRLM